MKKFILSILTCAAVVGAAAFPKAIYVKQGDNVTKYSFAVAGDLVFGNNGKSLSVTGYSDVINLDNVDYISFSAPVGDTGLTPSQQKQRMIEIGEEAYSMIDLNKNAGILNMWHRFFDHLYSDGHYVHPPVEYEVPEEYYDVHKAAKKTLSHLGGLVTGSPADIKAFKSGAVDLYRVEDYFGVYYANPLTEKWEKTSDANYLEIRFDDLKGGIYSVKLTASDDYTTWTTKDFDGRMPRTMTITFSQGTTTFATAVISTVLVQDKSIDMTLDFAANGYVVKNVLKVTDTAIVDDVTVTIDGKQLVETHSNVGGKNLVNYDIMYNDVRESTHYHDENDECMGEDSGPLMAHFTRGTANADVLGKLQVKGHGLDLKGITDIMNEDDYLEGYINMNGLMVFVESIIDINGDVITTTNNNKDVRERKAKCLNDYTDASFFYDKSSKQQGYITWDVVEDIYEWDDHFSDDYGYIIKGDYLISVYRRQDNGLYYYDGFRYDDDGEWLGYEQISVPTEDVIFPEIRRSVYYEVTPIFTFPDMTTFMFEDFFDEDSFSKIVDDYNDIIDTYFKITGQDEETDNYPIN